MRQLVIPAAGRNTRFGAPKLLAEVAGESVIRRTLRFAQGLFDDVLVLVGQDHGVPRQVTVEPGTGSAGALREIASLLADDVTVLWSDIVLVGPTLEELLAEPLQFGVAPYVPEIRPYCHLALDGDAVTGVDYGKPLIGNHDQGIFRFGGDALKAALRATACQNLLECFGWLHRAGMPVRAHRTSFPTLGFNEPAKLGAIRALLN